ncbi:MAG: ThiF family adenylyltransferase [Candidatus Izemoplasmatales bacterium]
MILRHDRFQANLGILSPTQQQKIHSLHVMIVGVGGLGGHVSHLLARLGIGSMTLVDPDTFSLSNLNRQLFSTSINLGKLKVEVISAKLHEIDSQIHITAHPLRFEALPETAWEGIDAVIDCTDAPPTKVRLANLASEHEIDLLHGACAGWYGEVGWMSPHQSFMAEWYGTQSFGLERDLGNPSFNPAAIASIMVSEFVKWAIGKPIVRDDLLLIDLENNQMRRLKDKKEDS